MTARLSRNFMQRKYTESNKLLNRTKKIIPLAAQTFSKSYLQYIKGQAPLFITKAKGATTWDVDGNQYTDFINCLAAIVLGYQHPAVDQAIRRQLQLGINFSLPSPLEAQLAQMLIKLIPCAEMVRFGKNGSDVTTGAIRVARAVTGRDHVAACGYHGWHDWYIGSTTRSKGVPAATKKLTHKFIYNDIDSLKKIFKQYPGQIAAVIMEPMSYIEPQPGFLAAVKKVAHQHGALLIFDEVVTGFRFHIGGAQKLFGVTPDLATFGKAMANGMPIAALVGRRKYMKEIDNIFYSFTHGGEVLSIAASIATITELQKKKAIQKIWRLGRQLQRGTVAAIKNNGLTDVITVAGKPCWQVIIFKSSHGFSGLEIKSYVQQEFLQRGILWYGQHNMSYSHTVADINRLSKAYSEVLGELKILLETKQLRKALRGKPITDIFSVR